MKDEEKKVGPTEFLFRYPAHLPSPYAVPLYDVSGYRTLGPGEMRIREDPRIHPLGTGEQDPGQSAPPPPENPEA